MIMMMREKKEMKVRNNKRVINKKKLNKKENKMEKRMNKIRLNFSLDNGRIFTIKRYLML